MGGCSMTRFVGGSCRVPEWWMHIRRLEEIGRDLAGVEAAIDAAMRPFAAQ